MQVIGPWEPFSLIIKGEAWGTTVWPTGWCISTQKEAAFQHPFTREVVLLPQYRGTVLRNKVLWELQHQKCIQPLKFKHSMSSLEVKNVIRRGFQQINGFSSFHYLECIQNNRLAVVASQNVDGEFVSTKKGGSLYLCEVCEEVCSLYYSHTQKNLWYHFFNRMWWKWAFLQVVWVKMSNPLNGLANLEGVNGIGWNVPINL